MRTRFFCVLAFILSAMTVAQSSPFIQRRHLVDRVRFENGLEILVLNQKPYLVSRGLVAREGLDHGEVGWDRGCLKHIDSFQCFTYSLKQGDPSISMDQGQNEMGKHWTHWGQRATVFATQGEHRGWFLDWSEQTEEVDYHQKKVQVRKLFLSKTRTFLIDHVLKNGKLSQPTVVLPSELGELCLIDDCIYCVVEGNLKPQAARETGTLQLLQSEGLIEARTGLQLWYPSYKEVPPKVKLWPSSDPQIEYDSRWAVPLKSKSDSPQDGMSPVLAGYGEYAGWYLDWTVETVNITHDGKKLKARELILKPTRRGSRQYQIAP